MALPTLTWRHFHVWNIALALSKHWELHQSQAGLSERNLILRRNILAALAEFIVYIPLHSPVPC